MASHINDRLDAIDKELDGIEVQIQLLKERRNELYAERHELVEQAAATQEPLPDYTSNEFPWSQQLIALAKKHWNIRQFRSLQLPVLNAALDRERDLFVVLPTGGGKSLCYQLPALIEKGFTLVVSPLVALIKDQVYHLKEAGVPVAALTAATTKEETTWVQSHMVPKNGAEAAFKLLYVTPEKIAKSKRLMSKINQAYDAGMLSRIVIDEAHCCSQQGHDFRPDYKLLNVLRTVLPKTPIMALTATCPWSVMKDVIDILGLKPPQARGGTLVFSAPLYRPNLIYKVLPKPEKEQDTIRHITQWILDHHPISSGIIYCLTKKDTHTVSDAIYRESHGQIRCGVYHADLDDDDKSNTHELWRENKIQVIVATIAFGMGINHPGTRFIIHHSMSKSLEGYYQESGRAGRDGIDADCVLYYRGQDANRLSSMVVGEVRGAKNLYSMIRYAQDYTTCRKVLFETYFSTDSSIAQTAQCGAATLVNAVTPNEPCGKCDNCTRDPDEICQEDITLAALTIVKLCQYLKQRNERVTMNKLIQLLRGRGLKAANLDRVSENKDMEIPISRKYSNKDLEQMINHLLVNRYLAEDFHFTPYSTISYIVEGSLSRSLHHLSKEDIKAGKSAVKITMTCLRSRATIENVPKVKRRRIITLMSDNSDNDWDDNFILRSPSDKANIICID